MGSVVVTDRSLRGAVLPTPRAPRYSGRVVGEKAGPSRARPRERVVPRREENVFAASSRRRQGGQRRRRAGRGGRRGSPAWRASASSIATMRSLAYRSPSVATPQTWVDASVRPEQAVAAGTALAIGAGHSIVVFLRDGLPVNVVNQIEQVPEVCQISCAMAKPSTSSRPRTSPAAGACSGTAATSSRGTTLTRAPTGQRE